MNTSEKKRNCRIMELEDKDFLTSQFLQHFHEPESKTKNYQHEELNQLLECIKIIKEDGELKDKIDSLNYILYHIGSLESDDSIEIGPFILNYALDLNNVELSLPSIHILTNLINNHSLEEYYEPIRNDFIQNAIENVNIILAYCQEPLSDSICDLILSFVTFSNEILTSSLENQLVEIIINDDILDYFMREYKPNESALKSNSEILDQMIFRLKLISSITESLTDQNRPIPILLIYEKLSYIYNNVSKIMNMYIPPLYDRLLKIYDAFFEFETDPQNKETYNLIFQPLFEDFFQSYGRILNEKCTDITFFLNILLNFSKKDFAIDFINKYPIYDFIINNLQYSTDNINNDSIDITVFNLSWSIVANFIFKQPEQIKHTINIDIPIHALIICDEGTIEMKSFVIKYLSNFFYCLFDQQIYEFVESNKLLVVLLSLVECLPLKFSEYIISSVAFFISDPKTPSNAKRTLMIEANTSEVINSLTDFIELYPDNDVYAEGTYILGYLEEQHDEYYNPCNEEEEEGPETP